MKIDVAAITSNKREPLQPRPKGPRRKGDYREGILMEGTIDWSCDLQ